MFGIASERYCNLCGKRIVGMFTQYNTGLIVCQQCEQTAPRCARCRVPVRARTSTRSPKGVILCAPCSRAVAHCACCAEPILGMWYRYEELIPTPEPRHFCANCVSDKPRCDLCRAPAGPRSITLSDGQYRCGLCASDLVIGEGQVRLSYTTALEELVKITGGPLRRTPPLDIVSRRRMGEIRRAYATSGSPDSGLLPALPTGGRITQPPLGARVMRGPKTGGPDGGLTRHLLGFYVRSQGKPIIYVEAGLTRGLLFGTLAHELAHAWQAEQFGNGAGALDPLVSEGFAEWVAYTALLARGYRTLAGRARERNDVYGQGLNRCLQIEATQGRPAVLTVGRNGHF